MKRGKTLEARERTKRPIVPTPSLEWAYFFDLDGTLVEIAPTPGGVRSDNELRHLIEWLHDASQGAVAVITGRSIVDIDRLFPNMRLPVAGQHGIERRDATGQLTRHPFPAHVLDEARRQLREVVARYPALLVEDKGLSLAIHYRSAPRLASYAHHLARDIQLQLGPSFSVQPGKRVVEIKPAGKDKGIAVREFMREHPFRGRTPVFVGDDATDEYGFAMVNRLHGFSLKVGGGKTVARWRLANVHSVRKWLTQVLPSASLNARKVAGVAG